MSSDAFDQTVDAGTATQARTALAPGAQMGKYRLDRVLGEGGMGVVWAAHDPDLERAIAIKVLRYAQASTQLRQRLLREARAMAKLKHPNVLTVYEVGTVDDRDYIAMELVEGATLDTWFQHATADERWHAMLAAGRGLAAAHAAGVVHRDFKPHNVLRSRDGRVLVTDFGLARGLLGEGDSAAVAEEVPVPASVGLEATLAPPREGQLLEGSGAARSSRSSASPAAGSGSGLTSNRASDSILDSPLTQTGALIGTPAYMAPEQYVGAPPDPRTDQFAFCVTVWQAIAGERPFKGTTLDEMRRASGGGVEHLSARLPRAVRAVLARGLDPEAKRRWPSLEDLLDALERAGRAPARRRNLAFAALGLAMVAGLLIVPLVRGRGRLTAEQQACAAPDRAFAEAWSPAVRAELTRVPGVRPESLARVTGAFDHVRDRWVESYHQACRLPVSKGRTARVGCLEGMRDQVAVLSHLLRTATPQLYDAFDGPGMLPNLRACEGAMPLAPLPVPADQPRRDKVLAVLAHAVMLRQVAAEQLEAVAGQLDLEAAAAGWPPLTGLVHITTGNEMLRRQDPTKARARFVAGLDALGRATGTRRDVRVETMAHLGMLEASMIALAKPRAPVPPMLDQPRTKATLHPELAGLIAAARTAAGSDPMMLGSVAFLDAKLRLDAAQWNRYREAYDAALEKIAEARKQFDVIGDVRRTASAFGFEAGLYLERGDERALDDAMFAARQGADLLERAQHPPSWSIERARADIAFARRDYTEAHRRLDAIDTTEGSAPALPGWPLVTGRVLGGGGRTVTIIAWRGELVGDRSRAYTDPFTVDGEIVQAAADGSFSIHAAPGSAILAEAKGLRSRPRLVGSGSPSLELLPTTSMSGTVTGHNLHAVRAFARFDLGGASFVVQVPVDRDQTFDLVGLPPGTPRTGLSGTVGHGTREVLGGPGAAKLAWPSGQAVEVIVRGPQTEAARVYVFRGEVVAATEAELDAAIARSGDVATGVVMPIGASATDAGREHYEAGDRHAVITGNADGPVTVCAAGQQVACRRLQLSRTVEVSYPDGRVAGGVTPIVIEL